MVGGHGSMEGTFKIQECVVRVSRKFPTGIYPSTLCEILDNHLTALFAILLIVASQTLKIVSGLANVDEGAESFVCSHDLFFPSNF